MKPSTRKRLFRGVLYAIFVLGVAAVVLVADGEAIRTNFFNLDVAVETFPGLITIAAKNTVVYTMIAFAGAMRLERNPALAQRDYAFNVRPRWPLDELEAA